MKAIMFYGIKKLELVDIPIPSTKSDEMLIKVEACSICGSDLRIFNYGSPRIQQLTILGHEIVGTIEVLGENIKSRYEGLYYEGQRVGISPAVPCGRCYWCKNKSQNVCDNLKIFGYEFWGGFSQFLHIPAVAIENRCIIPVPEVLSTSEATLIEPLACVLNAQQFVGVNPSDTILIIGAGVMGLLHYKLASFYGAQEIIICDKVPERIRNAKALGIENACINSELKQRLNERGADLVIVAAGTKSALEDAFKYVAKRGKIVLFAGLPGEEERQMISCNQIHYNELTVVGTHGSTPEQYKEALRIVLEGKLSLKDLIKKEVTLEEAIAIFRQPNLSNDKPGRVIIYPNK
ncbi:alcohol dehydrogenase catalytic domain-containing protein [Neomoorella humiferrea]|uniref:alcohol dehydrogenase catalytic domain-containing protein n=1 Tax=Neomoorella humiferrea TaxID=676965 RepID=UPI003D93822A